MATMRSYAAMEVKREMPAFTAPIVSVKKDAPRPASLAVVARYRDAAVWRLLRLERRVDADDLRAYWEIMDALMDISLASAILLLQHLYEYRVQQLTPAERHAAYPGVTNDLYRLAYDDQPGGSRDVCAATLIMEALDVLQEEAERLARH